MTISFILSLICAIIMALWAVSCQAQLSKLKERIRYKDINIDNLSRFDRMNNEQLLKNQTKIYTLSKLGEITVEVAKSSDESHYGRVKDLHSVVVGKKNDN